MKKFLSVIFLFFLIQSCDDKKTQQFGGVNLTIQKQTYEESSEVDNEVEVEVNIDKDDFELRPLKNKEIKTNVIKSDDVFRNFRVKNEDDFDNNLKLETSENQITDIDAVRVTLNNGQPTTVPIINGSASYSRDGLAVGVIPIKVDLLGGGLEKYTQTKSVSIVANQNSPVSFNSFFVMNQQISITNSSFGSTVVQGDQISFEWTNTHAEQPVQIAVIQNNDTNIIQTLEPSYIGTSYVLNTTNSNPTNNIGFKVSSNVASNTSSSICCFDLVANSPQANDVSSTVNEDSSVTVQLDGSSPGGESVTYSIVSNPSNGSLSTISGSNVTYTPNQDYNGSDSFTYKVNNGSQDSNTATVTLTINAVNDAPVANNISAETNFNDAVDLQFDASDVDGDNLSYFIVSGASNGTLTLHSNNQVEYLPNSGFSGSDTFTYGATDGSLNSNTATATVTVGEAIELTFPNGGEELSINSTYNITWNNGFSNTGIELRKDGSKILDISGDAGDVDSFAWTVPSNLTPGDGYVIRVYDAGAGSVFDESDNTFSILGSSDDTFVEQVSIDFTSNNTITTQNVLYSNKNYYLKVSGQGSYSGGNRIDAAYISSNSNWSNPEPWVDSFDNDSWMFNDINIRQSLRPNPDQYNSSHVYYYYFQGNDSTQAFGFKDCNYSSHCYGDNSGGLTVEIYESDNSAPTVENITVSTVYEQAISIELDGSDVDGDNLTYNINTNPSNGTIAFTGNSTISYNPNSGFTGNDSFTYSASDGSLDSNVATVSISISDSSDGASGKFDSSLGGKGIKIAPAGEVFSNEFTLSFYLKIDMSNDSNDKVHGIIRSIFGSTTPGFALRVHPRSASSNAGTLDFTFSDGTQDNPVYSNFSLADNADWNHFTIVKNNNSVDFYVNGSLDKSHSVSFNNIANGDAYIGSAAFIDDYQRLNGLMDEFVLWDNSLNSNQISTLASSGSPLGIMDSSLKMYYQFNANEGSNIIDHSGNNNNGVGEAGFSYSSDVPGAIDVNNAPTTEDINVSIDENRTNRSMVDITLEGNDIDGDALTYSLVTTPQNGTYSIENNILTYNANQDWNGVETFTYKANDGTFDSNISSITITVNPVNDNPVVTVGDPFAENNKSGLFDGGSKVSLGTMGDLSGQDIVTVQVWVAPNTTSQQTAATVISKGNNINFTYRQYGMGLNKNNSAWNDQLGWSWFVSTTNGEKVAYSSSVASISEWTHLVGVYDGQKIKLYVNGVLESSVNHTGNINGTNSTGESFSIGHLSGGGQYYYTGYIDEVAMWNLALSDTQVSDLYNAGLGINALNLAASDLYGYWNFEDDFQDQSGNSRHGTGQGVTFDDNIPTGLYPNSFTTDEDTPLNIDLSSYVSDVDNDDLAVSFTSNATNGSLSANNLIITYTPNLNFNGNDSFSWSVSDGTVSTGAVNANIVVSSVNDAPVTTNQSATTVTNQALDITLTSTDIESDSITYSIVSDVSNGSTSLNGAVVTYTPSSDFSGSDSFTFKANDGTDDSNVSTVTINVNSSSIINVPGDYSNIQDAINNALDGTKIIVASGTYNVNDLNITKDIILKGSGMGSTILDGQGSNRIMTINATGQDTLRIIDMTIKNGNALSSGGYVVGFEGTSTIAKFENIVFENNGGGTGNTLFRGLGPDKTFYVNSIIRNNSAENCAGIGEATVYGCLIYGNTGWNNPSPVNASKVYSTTITGNSGGVSTNAWTNGGATNSQITNSIIYDNSPKDLYYYSNSPYSGVTYSTITNGYNGTGNISSDPQFNNSSAQNYGLSSSSPALNNGDPSMTDPDGTRIDMGAYLDSNGDVYDDPNSQH